MQSGDKGGISRGFVLLPLEGLGVETAYVCLLKHIWIAYKCHALYVILKYPKEKLDGIKIISLVAMFNSIPLYYIWEAAWQPTAVLLTGEPQDGRAWKAAVHGVAKSRTRLNDFTFTFHFHALEKEMATHSSVLAWRIPGMGEPGGLPSMGSHRVRHD